MSSGSLEDLNSAMMAELNGQKASTLGRYGRRLEAESRRCAMSLDLLDGPADASEVNLRRYRDARQSFMEARSAFIFQREMLGLLEHHRVDDIFPIPPPR